MSLLFISSLSVKAQSVFGGEVGNKAQPVFGDEVGNNSSWAYGSGKITTSGKVGIGTISPGRKLEVFNSYDNFVRVTSSGGSNNTDYQAGIELRRKPVNGPNYDWALVNQGDFRIKLEGQKIFNLHSNYASFGHDIDNPMEVIFYGMNVEEVNSGASKGTLQISSKKNSIVHTLRIDGNQLESKSELSLNAFSNENIALVNGGGKVKVGTTNEEAKMNIASEDNMQLKLMNSGNGGESWRIGVANNSWAAGAGKLVFTNTNSSSDATMAITPTGRVEVKVLEIKGGADLAEPFEIANKEEEIIPGSVVSIDSKNIGQLKVAQKAYDKTVAGIVSGAGNIQPGMVMGQDESIASGKHPVALTGRVYCRVDATYGAIQPGDLLTTSATPGHAMKVKDHNKAQGAIIGKAMTTLEEGKGLVLVLVSLQ